MATEQESSVKYLIVCMDDWHVAAKKLPDGTIDVLYENHYYEDALDRIVEDHGLKVIVRDTTDEDEDHATETGRFNMDRLEDYFKDV